MKRLTERDEYGNAEIIGVDSDDLQFNLRYGDFNKVTEALNKLAAYEDIGPTPEQLKEVDRLYAEQAAKLQHYEGLRQQGRLPEFPCAEGDTVYTIYSDEDGAFIEKATVKELSTHRIWIDSMYFDYEDIGKTVFFIQQEAEDKLKELEGKE